MNESNRVKADNLSVEQLDAIYTQCLGIASEVCAIARSDQRVAQAASRAVAADEKPVMAYCHLEISPDLVLQLANTALRLANHANRLLDGQDEISRQADGSKYSPEAPAANGPKPNPGPI